ncbi:SIMPL domain-containing protein [Candidatus Marimicrobium litorale]|uniref:SIMPL domain-containing protein n=1 Tax=Candidatus Marimicrobium litorale TaxID=2518991 RepID=A0ABT3T0S9_9GAMM|nr:SIMPL domain-containing protein [Candidatus Marimicrobium litorale]MCX2975862.1 SIMPL domain-containing protein [Candidatus Marimicrobium litorale]
MKIGSLHPLACLFIVVSLFVQPARAEDLGGPRIIVSGEGTVEIAPDMAILSLVVMREAPTAEGALATNSAAMTAVMKAMTGAGIAERDIQTTQFSIQPRYSRETRKPDGTLETRKLVGYTVRNGVNVRVRDIDAVGEVLDMSVRLGVNEGGGIQFSNADPTKALERARSNAVKDAMDKARGLASAAGGKVGRVLEISEHSMGARPMNMARREMAMDSMKVSVPIAAGENTYRVSISLSVALEQ